MDKIPLKALLFENPELETHSISESLENSGFSLNYERISNKQQALQALGVDAEWDLIISSHTLPGFSFVELQQLLLERGLDIPLIIVTDPIGEKLAVELMRGGVFDILIKDDLSRLGSSVADALQTSQINVASRSYQQHLQRLVIHQEDSHEKERVNFARDIHDELGTTLTAIKLEVRWLQKKCASTHLEAEEKFSLLADHLDGAINSARRIITELRPSVLDDLGLFAALEWQLNEFEKRYNIECNFDNRATETTLIDKRQEVALFRIVQESLLNIAKHAKASKLVIKVTIDNNNLHLEITDNGIGISNNDKQNHEHYGIFGMNERALSIGANLDIAAIDSGGTRVSLSLPCNNRGER